LFFLLTMTYMEVGHSRIGAETLDLYRK